jgi:hypothetical protein
MPNAKKRCLTTFERKLMLAMGLKDVRRLDQMLKEPVSQDAERHRGPPDEVYELAERMYEEMDLQRSAQGELEGLFGGRYLN